MGNLVTSFLWVLHASITASIAALLIILISKLFSKCIGVRLQHALWIIVVIKLIIPVQFQSNLSLFNLLNEKYPSSYDIENKSTLQNMAYNTSDFLREGKDYWNYKSKNQIAPLGKSSENVVDKQKKLTKEYVINNVLNIASCIWLAGVISVVIFLLIIDKRFKRKILNLEELKDLRFIQLLEQCKKKANINVHIPVYVCDSFKSPCILGVFKPKIYIPRCICDKREYRELYHVLLHELIHYKRKDLVYNFLAVLAVIMHWFNPIIWFCMKKMKLQRECTCDAYVLEIIGEEEAEEYGMALINFSKMVSNDNKVPQLAIFFETKNQIRRRIEMIKDFKKGSYRMSAAAIVCCVVASGIVLTNAVNAKSIKSDNIAAVVSNNSQSEKQESKFIIDSPRKSYYDMKKVQQVVGFKFKVPDFIPQNCGSSIECFHVLKISDKDNLLKIFFDDKENRKDSKSFTFQVSRGDMEQFLRKDAEQEGEKEKKLETPGLVKDKNTGKVEISKKTMNLAGVNGVDITIKTTLVEGSKSISGYFVWQNEGMWYGIEYKSDIEKAESSQKSAAISEEDLGKIAASIKYVEDVKNVNYSVEREVSTELATFMIYDKEDLKKAKELLGFDPKLPLTINNDIKIKDSAVGISGDSDIENKKINYELNTFYNLKEGILTFNQGKNVQDYENIKKNGYVKVNDKEIKVQTLQINNKEVFKYEESFESQLNKQSKTEEYIWQENGFCCRVSIIGQVENSDQIAKEFVASKPID